MLPPKCTSIKVHQKVTCSKVSSISMLDVKL